jgi:MFS family permease
MGRAEAADFRVRDHAAVNALWIGLQFQDAALLAIIVPAIVLRLAPQTHTFVLASLATAAAFSATLVPPFAGFLSDRARRAGGDRRLQTAVLLAVDALALLAMSRMSTTFGLGAMLVLATVAFTATTTIYQVLLPEVVPRQAWGTAAGVRGAMTLFGTIAGLLTAALLPPGTALVLTAGFIAVCAFSLVAIPAAAPVVTRRAHAVVRDRRDLGITLVARAWIVLGMTLLNTYVLYFFSDVLGIRNASLGTGLVAGAALVGAVVSSVWAGTLSDRADRRLVVALSGIPMILAALGFAIAPDVRAIFVYAVLFGLGYGGVFSVGWALALDAVPELGDVARDLGVWGTLSNLPAVIAPSLGAFVISHGSSPSEGYRWLFALAGVCFALGSISVLDVGRRRGAPHGSVPFLLAVIATHLPYMALRTRVRQWGRLPFRRGPTLLVANHQHEDESGIIVLRTFIDGPWRSTVYTASSRRMYEPGFFALRIPWTAPLTRHLNAGGLFLALGMLPLENQLSSRPLESLAAEVRRRHGNLRLDQVFRPDVVAALDLGDRRISDLWDRDVFARAQTMTRLTQLLEPYRSEATAGLRASVEEDIARISEVVRAGATFFVTPEGTYSTDGRMHPIKGIIDRLAPLAEMWFAAIAFDPFRGRRLPLLYRIVRAPDGVPVATALAAARPITTSALAAAQLQEWSERPFEAAEFVQAVRERRAALPAQAFVDPEFDAAPERVLHEALALLVRRGILVRDGDAFVRGPQRTDPRFALTADIVAYQAAFLAESIAALRHSP